MHVLSRLFFFHVLCLMTLSSLAQWDTTQYRLRLWTDVPILLGTAAATTASSLAIGRQERLNERLVLSLQQSDVNALDRRVFGVDFNESGEARHRSDVMLGASVLAPLLLPLDRKVRAHWQPYLLLYAEGMLINTSVQSWTAIGAGRYRPIAYMSQATPDQRTAAVNHNSFFSGHTSATATATFFMARVLDGVHPELGKKRWLLYAGALVPPALTGWWRMRAGKHFPTDVVTGLAFGSAVGILVPMLHRTGKDARWSFLPFLMRQGCGLAMSVTWKG